MMKTPRLRVLPLLGLAIALGLAGAGAAAPSGPFIGVFGPQQGTPLWNFKGDHWSILSSSPDDHIEFSQDARGRISASFLTLGSEPAELFGSIKISKGELTLRLSSRRAVLEPYFNGTDWYSEKRKHNFTLTFEPWNRTLFGFDRVTRMQKEEITDWYQGGYWNGDYLGDLVPKTVFIRPVSFQVPATADGMWTLRIYVVPAKSKLTGAGTITFSNGDTLKFLLRGTYVSSTDKAKIVLKGDLEDKGATLMLSLRGPEFFLESMKGTVYGQKIQYP